MDRPAESNDVVQTQIPASQGKLILGRYLRALGYFAPLTLHILLWEILLRRIGFRGMSNRTADRRYTRWAQRFRELATHLGGIWIKVGQFLSSRVDVIPASVTNELAALQDEVAPEPLASVQEVVESEFDMPLDACFEAFDPQPLASASLGQVHRALLEDGSRAGFDNDFTQRNTTIMTWNLMHLAKILANAGGYSNHGNDRTAWKAGCRFDFENPEHRA